MHESVIADTDPKSLAPVDGSIPTRLRQRLCSSTGIALALIALIGAFYVLTLRDGHVWGDDQAAYIHHAKNMVEGRPYGDIGFVRSPTSISPMMYPPGFPLLLAPIYRGFGLNLTAMKVMGIAFFGVVLLFLYLVARNHGETVALITIVVIGLCPYFWDFKDTVVSEFPFLAFTFAALWLSRQAMIESPTILLGIGAGTLAGLAYITRSAGIVLPAAMVLAEFLGTRRLGRFSFGCLVSFAGIAVLQKLLFPVHSDYLTPLLKILTVHSLLASPWYYLKCLAVPWDNGYSSVAQMALYLVFATFALYGAWATIRSSRRKEAPIHDPKAARHRMRPVAAEVTRFQSPKSPTPFAINGRQRLFEATTRFIRRLTALELFAIFYFLLIILFPWGGRRYLMPIMPIFVLYAVLGLQAVAKNWSCSARRFAYGTVALAVLLTFSLKYTTLPWGNIPGGIRTAGFSELVDYIKAKPDGVTLPAFFKARLLALYSNTRVAELFRDSDSRAVLDYYRRIGVSHLVCLSLPETLDDAAIERFILAHPQHFHFDREIGAFRVFRIVNSPSSTASTIVPQPSI